VIQFTAKYSDRLLGKSHSRKQRSRIRRCAKYEGLFLCRPRLLGWTRPLRSRHRLGHEVMMRRQIADGVGVRRVAGHQKGLTSAPAEIARLFRAAAAWLLHPVITAKVVESRRVEPGVLHAGIADIRKFKPG